MEENHSYSQVIGTSSAPTITNLANTGSNATNYHGVIHPSVNNYLAFASGQTYSNITDSCTPGGTCSTSAPNLADQLEAAGYSWKGYFEDMPSPGFDGYSNANYVARHNPFVYFSQIRSNSVRNDKMVPYPQLATDLASTATTPNFVWVTPNLQDDMHDGTVAQADTWLKNNFLPNLYASPAWKTEKDLLIVTSDEDDFTTANLTFWVAQESPAAAHVSSGALYNHYSSLRTIEDSFGLSHLANAGTATSMTDLVGDTGTVSTTTTAPASTTTMPQTTSTTVGTTTSTTAPSTSGSSSSSLAARQTSYVYSGSVNSNYGGANPLLLSYKAYRTLLEFDTSAIPSTAQISSAELIVTPTVSESSGGIEVHPGTSGWSQPSVTWANQPAWNSTVLSKSGVPVAGAALSINLPTSAVHAGGLTDLGLGYSVSGLIVRINGASATAHPVLKITDSSGTTTSTTTSVPVTTTTVPSGGGTRTTTPIRAAFFYPWFPANWTQGGFNPATHYQPLLGYYSSTDLAVIRSQIAAMQYANINTAISSWWGQGSIEDNALPTLLSAEDGTGSPNVNWSLYYEPAITGGATQINSDLSYIMSHYASNPYYLHTNGKPVLFVYSRAVASCADTSTWVNANAGRFYLDLQVFSGYTTCAAQPDNWHQYGPAVAEDRQKGHSFSISPGYWKYDTSTPLLTRDLTRWTTNVKDMVASGEPWQLITTFNEWGEGTSVEDALAWHNPSTGESQYLDVLHNN